MHTYNETTKTIQSKFSLLLRLTPGPPLRGIESRYPFQTTPQTQTFFFLKSSSSSIWIWVSIFAPCEGSFPCARAGSKGSCSVCVCGLAMGFELALALALACRSFFSAEASLLAMLRSSLCREVEGTDDGDSKELGSADGLL